MLLKTLQNSQEILVLEYLFNKVAEDWSPTTLFKKDSSTGFLLVSFAKFLRIAFFYKTPLVVASEIYWKSPVNSTPWSEDVNWTYIRRSEDIQDVFRTPCACTTYVLCPRCRSIQLNSIINVLQGTKLVSALNRVLLLESLDTTISICSNIVVFTKIESKSLKNNCGKPHNFKNITILLRMNLTTSRTSQLY